ncbi:transglycosylase domain-containing protein [Octadecabacter sp. G9-8]|uniref:Transglycosylase domain-containing protein n=1 Tax=Octadecabacter dasysiphoniae TaxID=2909341 RepID=A0ABS9CYN2_9RHOB|nr:transglycosylase domain-containing protein [Octadecabacter dasysiphoniae]MCF2872263.1 transglycosylase domain-containing protein [Octadecabacter dasysiphoniae]
MIRLLAVLGFLAGPAFAQGAVLPDSAAILAMPNVDLSDPPPQTVRDAILASQDINFLSNPPSSSTMAQQIVRTYLNRAGDPVPAQVNDLRFVAPFALDLSHTDIITIYSQSVDLGAGCYGFGSALFHRMGIDLNDATLKHAATMAALINTPEGFWQNPEDVIPRYDRVAMTGENAGLWDKDTASLLIADGPAMILANSTCPPDS